MRKKKETIEVLEQEELRNFIKFSPQIAKCNLCNNDPQIIKKTGVDKYGFEEAKYKIYCPTCQVGTGFSSFNGTAIDKWNKKMSPIKYKDCHIYAFTPSDEQSDILMEDYKLNFSLREYEIVHGKGGSHFLYYIYDKKERKLNQDIFVDDVALYGANSFSMFIDGIPKFKVCVVIANNKEDAAKMLNKRLGDFFKEGRKTLNKKIENYEELLHNAELKLKKYNDYINEISKNNSL